VSLLGNGFSVDALRYLRKRIGRFDVVHGHAHFYSATNVAALLSHFVDVPLAITNHSLISQSVPEWIARLHLKTVGKLTFDSADVIFCYTEEEKRKLRMLCNSVEILVVSNGIDQHRFSPEGPRSSIVPETDGRTVLFVGRLVDGKRPQDAIEAFAKTSSEFENSQLVLCGEGPLRAELEARVEELGIGDATHFLGLVDYDEMPGVFRAADVLLLPSRSEGFPRTLMEAFSTETPVIASDLDQTAALVRRAGRVAPVEDVEAVADHLRELLAEPALRETLGKEGRRIIKTEGYSWESSVEQTTKALQRLV
jgi:glycosyltransferase involved in cell wall biosynthesis